MKIYRIILLLLIFLFLTSPTQGYVNQEPKTLVIESNQLDKRAQILSNYFAKYNSPLQYHAQDFIDAADTYNVDWKLVPAIAGVESTFGKFIPGGYNAYGWAIYNPNSKFGFKSWKHGIFTVTEGLRTDYINKGLKDPYAMNKKYAASPAWGRKVDYFIRDLDKFGQKSI